MKKAVKISLLICVISIIPVILVYAYFDIFQNDYHKELFDKIAGVWTLLMIIHAVLLMIVYRDLLKEGIKLYLEDENTKDN